MEDDQFEWDPEKNAKNIAKHKISFVAAKNVFFDPNAYDGFDLTSSHDEDRFFITGQVDGKILTVVYTNRGDRIRLISAWPATRREIDDYYSGQSSS